MSIPMSEHVPTMGIEKSAGKFGWDCECGAHGGYWDYWETAEMVVLSHRRDVHAGRGFIEGYDLRPGRSNG
jgi:hypothetical protein